MLKLPKLPNLTELAYTSVKQQLLNGSFLEGAKLTEEFLAGQLGISKSPVREALMRLESEGLIVIEARRGAYVRKFSAKEAKDLYAVRELLEVHAVSTAEVSPELLAAMQASVERTYGYLESHDKSRHIEEDIHFHGLIASATRNDELCRVLDNIQQKSLLCRMATYHLSGSMAPASHRHIYTALLEGDRDRARKAMREHILSVRDALLSALDTEPEMAEDPVLAD